MTHEEELEGITPELLPSNELVAIINETALPPSLANEFRINFEQHFKMAATWAKKAKNIIVTDASQTVVMQEARTARLFLRSKRLEIETFRVARKEYYLKGGRAIDKVANFLKDTIIPIETYLESQEKFVEFREKAKEEKILSEAKSKEESERLQKEKAEREELEKLRREKQEQMKKEAADIKFKLALNAASDTTKIIKFRDNLKELINNFPDIKESNLIRISEDAKSHLWLAHSTLNQINEEEL